ncbi:MAG TPA: hypothetical protein VES38_07610 [Methylotenera sp.]|nr:hypothetical protein [Methylotenera sp.]
MEVNFFWGEDVVEQKNNKTMVIGLLPDRKLIIPKAYYDEIKSKPDENGIATFAIDRLAVLINVSEFDGDLKASGQFYNPVGETHGPAIALGTATLIKNRSYNIILQTNPFPFLQLGKFKLTVNVNGTDFESDITIEVDNL